MKKILLIALLALTSIWLFAQTVPPGLEWQVEGRSVTITGYTGSAATLAIPARIQGLPVTAIDCDPYTWGVGWGDITSVTIPDSVTTISGLGFGWRLTAIQVAAANTHYRSDNGVLYTKDGRVLLRYPVGKTGAFTIPSTVTTIGAGAFADCWDNLTGVTIPNSVIVIGDYAFFNCTGLTNVTIPDSVTTIGNRVFSGGGTEMVLNNITSITIGNGVITIGEEVFTTCARLTAINVGSVNISYRSDNGVLYSKDGRVLIHYPAGKAGSSFTIPDSVTSIGEYAFFNCRNLASLTIPASVIYIWSNAFSYFDVSNLISVTFGGSDTYIVVDNEWGGSVFPGDLEDKYERGGAGTYTRARDGGVWTKVR